MASRLNFTEVKGDFGDSAQYRLYRVDIQNEELVLVEKIPKKGTFAQDYENAIAAAQPKDNDLAPSYFLVHTDKSNEFILVTYVPDAAPVQRKMLFACWQNFLKRFLAQFTFKDTFFTSTKAELSYEAYKAHEASAQADAMTSKEKELLEMDREAMATRPMQLPGMTTSHSSSSSTSLPVTPDAADSITKLAQGETRHVILTVEDETVALIQTVAEGKPFKNQVPSDRPSYMISRIQGQYVLTFCCPTQTKIKDRMIASSSKGKLTQWLQQHAEIKLARRLEVSDLEDLPSEETLETEVKEAAAYQRKSSVGPADAPGPALLSQASAGFKRPKPPGRAQARTGSASGGSTS